MPSCSLKHCSSRRTKNQPQLSVHSFPKSNVLRGKWLKAIGEENINTRHKELRLCSLHFDESQLNRTLKIVRLCDNAVPTLFLRSRAMADNDRVVYPAEVEEVKAKAAANTDAGDINSEEQPCEEITIPKMSLRNMIQVPDNCPEGSEMDENGVCREVF